ncbi:hypothetical protein JOM56_002904 [Amanita muscaria]
MYRHSIGSVCKSSTSSCQLGIAHICLSGDSYTTTGFNPSGTLPSVGNPLGNPAYPGWTDGGGANWVDYLTTTYNQSLTLTYDFARGGATINSSLVTPDQGVSLEDEVNTFLSKFAHSPPSTPWKTWNTLFSIWIGINDIGGTYHNGGDRDVFSDVLLDSYFKLVEQLRHQPSASPSDSEAKARIFLFINVPPVDRSPRMLAKSVSDQEKERSIIAGFNDKLQTRIDRFKGNHADVRVWHWDSHTVFTSILDDPTSYGFQDATSYGDNPSYFWGNSYHPGAAAHKIFAMHISDTLDGFP